MSKHRLQCAILVITASMTALGASAKEAQTQDIEEVFVTGELSRYSAIKSDTPILETARSLSIESLEQILDKGAMALDDTYTYTSGVIGETFGFATRGDWIKVRGFDAPLYQDSLQSLFGNYNNTRPDIYTIEQVEISKGPASVLYGKGSPGGIVNIISKAPKEDTRHEVVLEIGSFNRKQIAFDSTGQMTGNSNWLYRLVGVYRDSETQVDLVDDQSSIFAPSVTWLPNDKTNITFLVNYTKTEGDTAAQFLPIIGTLFPAANGQKIEPSTYLGESEFNKYDAKTTALTLLADHEFNDVWSTEITARYTDASADYKQAWPSFIGGDRFVYNADGTLYRDGMVPRTFYRSDATSEQTAIDTRLRADFQSGNVEHEVLIGLQYQDVTTNDDGYYAFGLGYSFETGGPDSTFGDVFWVNVFDPVYNNIPSTADLDTLYTDRPENNATDIGLYVHDQISIDNWRITLGMRYDEVKNKTANTTQKDDAFSGGIGLLYQLENGFSPYISYAQSFEPVLGDNGNGQPLKPQEGEQFELGLKYSPESFPGALTIAYFDINQSNLPDPSNLIGSFEQQRGRGNSKGVELEGHANFGNFTLELNISKLETESAEGMQFASVPEKQASTWVTYKPGNGFKTAFGVRYVGDSYGGADIIRTPSYTLGDLMFGYEWNQWNFTINARNVTDKTYNATCLSRGDCFPGKERNVVARVTYKL